MKTVSLLSGGIRGTIVALSACAIGGCAWIDGDRGSSKFTYETTYEATDNGPDLTCAAEHLPKSFSQYETDEPFDNCVRMMMYESVTNRITENILAITFLPFDSSTSEPCPPIEDLVGKGEIAITENGCVRAMFTISRCRPARTLRVVGHMTLSEYSAKRGKDVEGTIEGRLKFVEKLPLTDGTYNERITDIGTVSGEFSYTNRAGSVWNH